MRPLLLFAILTIGTISNAATISFDSIGTGNVFTYNLTVSNERLMAGDFVVIYDFAGIQSASGPSADWTTLIIANDANAPNDPTLSDVRFTYSGATVTSSNGNPANQILIGPLTITSLYNSTRQDDVFLLTTNKNNAGDIAST